MFGLQILWMLNIFKVTDREFFDEVENFSLDKEDLNKKVDELLGKGAGMVPIVHFIIQYKKCTLSEALEIIKSCPNYHK